MAASCGGNVPPTFIERGDSGLAELPPSGVVGGMFPPPSLSDCSQRGRGRDQAGCGGNVPPTFIERGSCSAGPGQCSRRCGGNVPPTFIERHTPPDQNATVAL